MSMSINTNNNALIFRNALQKSISINQNIVGRLSSGTRINSASDDAAGLGLSKKILTAKNGNEVAKNNTQTGIAMLHTADGALDNMVSSLQRIRDLAVQSANGTYSQAERAMMQAETTQISSGVKQAYQTTTFGDKKIFRGEQASATEYADAIAAGYTDDRIIKTAAEFVSKISANTAGNFKLIADLDMSQLGTLTASAIASFTGQLEGNGHQISNLTINSTASNVGLFAQINGATIQNVALENVNINSATGGAGGFAEKATNSQITGCSVTGNISSGSRAGGFFRNITGGSVSNSYSAANVSANLNAGGFTSGLSSGATITNCYATGNVSGQDSGGFAVNINDVGVTVTNCYATGNVSGADSAGGFVLDNLGAVTNCYATGNVSGADSAGGFVSTNQIGANINNCYSLGSVTGGMLSGGFVGLNNSVITTSYTTGSINNAGGGFAGSGASDNTNFYKNNATSSSGSAVNANTTPPPTGTWDNAVWNISSDTPELKTAGLVVTASATPNGSSTGIQVGANNDTQSAIQANASFNIGNLNFNVRTQYAAQQTISRIDQTIASLNATRSDIGSQTNKLSLTLDNQDARIENYAQSNSVIGDANIAIESANLTKQQILQNFSTSVYQQSSNFDQNMILSIYNNL